jgi:DNA-binding transcriptional regulator GbsR (MarR family)
MSILNSKSPFVEKLGLLMESEGGSRVAGQLLGILLLAEAPLSLDELADRLAVSKPSVSINARHLEQKGLAVRVSYPGDRRDHYSLAPDLPASTFRARVESLARFCRVIAAGKDEVRSGSDLVRERFDRFSASYNGILDAMQRTLAALQAEEDRRTGTDDQSRDDSRTH